MMSCTSNPFWHDSTKNELILKGIVTAENKQTDVPVSIWMESFDQYTILLKNKITQSVYKHAVSTIVPSQPTKLEFDE